MPMLTKQDKEARRLSLREMLQEKNFRLIAAKDKADEFHNDSFGFLYLYWKQGKEPNIAIDPRVEYSELVKLGGVSLKLTELPRGLRYGTTMKKFPKEFESFTPANSQSHIGRMFSIQEESLSSFLNELAPSFPIAIHETGQASSKVVNSEELSNLSDDRLRSRRAPVSPVEDEQRRKKQAENGALGEILAMQYEIERLRHLSCLTPEACVDHVSLRDTGAGFDLCSSWDNEVRCIEVKAGEFKPDSFFISSNEVQTLTELKERGWIYLVDLSKKKDLMSCVTTIGNVGEKLLLDGVLVPTQFRATL